MTLIAALFAIGLGHFFPRVARIRHLDWLSRWTRWQFDKLGRIGAWRGPLGVVLVLVLPVLAAWIVQALLDEVLFGLAGFVYAVAVLIWAWGPRDLHRDVDTYLRAAASGDSVEQRRAAAALVPGELPPDAEGEANTVLAWVYLDALGRWFSVLFWFVILGPVGAVTYRLAHTLAHHAATDVGDGGFVDAARRLRRLLDWPACLLMTLGLALVGHFDAVIHAWREHYRRDGKSFFALDPSYLLAAARATLDRPPPDWNHTESPHANACQRIRLSMDLLWRILIIWLVVLALCTVIGWLA